VFASREINLKNLIPFVVLLQGPDSKQAHLSHMRIKKFKYGLYSCKIEQTECSQCEHSPSEAREPPAGTRFKAGRRPAAEASMYN
jgi:hypothetical protein